MVSRNISRLLLEYTYLVVRKIILRPGFKSRRVGNKQKKEVLLFYLPFSPRGTPESSSYTDTKSR